MLSELPGDAEKRDAILDRSHAEAGPEQRPPASRKMKQAETAVATAAAIAGFVLSKNSNVTLGVGATLDENRIVKSRQQPKRQRAEDNTSADDTAKPPPAVTDDAPLVPWVHLK